MIIVRFPTTCLKRQIGGGRRRNDDGPQCSNQPPWEVAITTELQIQETIAQCVSCMVFYFNSRKTWHVKGAMIAEVQATTDLVRQWGLSASAINDSLLGPIEDELVVRYGSVEGLKLSLEFAEVFNGLTGPGPVLTLAPA